MTEQPPTPETSPYASPRDEALYKLSVSGWSEESSGDIACETTGFFAYMSNNDNELDELLDALDGEMEDATWDARSLVGHFLIQETHGPSVVVHEFQARRDLMNAWNVLGHKYEVWLGEQE